MKQEEYYAGSLYVLRPSKIVDITGDITKSKTTDNHYVKQIVIFERKLRPTIAYKTLAYGFYDLFNEDNNTNYETKTRRYYYDAQKLRDYGVAVEDKTKYYYNVFSGDKVLLSDYLFGYNCQKSMISKIKFFKEPFSIDNMELKPGKSKELLVAKKFYTKEELQNTFEKIQTHMLEPMESIKSYKVVKQPSKRLQTNGIFVNTGTLYAGTDDDIEVRKQKSLEFFQKH